MTCRNRTPDVPALLKETAQRQANQTGAVHAVVKDGRRPRVVELDAWQAAPEARTSIRWLAWPERRWVA